MSPQDHDESKRDTAIRCVARAERALKEYAVSNSTDELYQTIYNWAEQISDIKAEMLKHDMQNDVS